MTNTAADLVQRAAALREAQLMEEALDTITSAAALNHSDPRALFGLAQIRFETWRPAADDFARALQCIPDNPDLIRNHALAMAAEGQGDAACDMLRKVLCANPGWIDGHRTLATLNITSGIKDGFDESYANAMKSQPDNLALRMAWFQHYAVTSNWTKAQQIIDDGAAVIGPNISLDLAALFIASESGDDAVDFAPYADSCDPGTDLCHVRYLLRKGKYDAAEEVAARHLSMPSARIFWPYLSLCWRLTGNERARWLDGNPYYAQTFDLDFTVQELERLAHILRGLHRLKSPYPEQSVRGGTQTDRQIFFHPDTAIQNAKAKITKALDAYINNLPSHDAGHPLLAQNRDTTPLFEGSWSVRLKGAGFHSSHTHVKGWISSAFYICVPSQRDMGDNNAGWLALGSPPPELGLNLPNQMIIEPRPARLVLFPSTTWHSTCPINSGERMTIAFDVKLPA
jgi:tetratricopeptide (TPR) repeat protein